MIKKTFTNFIIQMYFNDANMLKCIHNFKTMKQSIGSIIYQAVLEKKWLELEYGGGDEKSSRFCFALKDINFEKDYLYGDIFNHTLNLNCIPNPKPISRTKIRSASIINGSIYDPPTQLLEKIEKFKEKFEWLETDYFDNNILLYLEECYKFDNDPFLDREISIPGIELKLLAKNEIYHLNEMQFAKIVGDVLNMNDKTAVHSLNPKLAFNIFSIDVSGKPFVVAYRLLNVDFKNKTIKMGNNTYINKTFLFEGGQRRTLANYLSISANEFEENFDKNKDEYILGIAENYEKNEKTNTRGNIFILGRNVMTGLQEAFEEIFIAQKEKRLTQPLKAFFGSNRRLGEKNKNPYILTFNKNKVNIDQIRVVYNAMVNHITYVQGPPGTGKTETIFNVILSAFVNDKKCLVCSNNNFPINGIFEKMTSSFEHRFNSNSPKVKFYFPIIRIGNPEENKKTINYLKELLAFVKNKEFIQYSEEKTLKSKTNFLVVYDSLQKMLKEYEERCEIEELLKNLHVWSENINFSQARKMLDEQININQDKLATLNDIKNEDIQKNIVSSSDSDQFMNYLFYYSLNILRKLLSPVYKELRDIITLDDEDDAATKLIAYLKDDDNVRRFTNVFPIVVTTNLSAPKLGSPKQHFDLCIMDEAGQCNMATALISIIRAKNLLLVGDLNQLQPVTVLDQKINETFMKKHGISQDYNYINNSILKLMQTKDKNSKQIFLRYHYRCGKKIANFSNKRFYNGDLILKSDNEGYLHYYNVKNKTSLLTNSSHEEAEQIVKIILENEYDDVAIVTPFVNQAKLINKMLEQRGIKNVIAGTIHTVQGTEKNTIIFSSAISLKTKRRTMDWIKHNQELINVANTRAKDNLIFVGDREAIDFFCGKEDSDLKSFSDYIANEGNYEVLPSQNTFVTNFSNDSQSEIDFFETISPYFEHRASKFDAKRNVLIKNMIKNLTEEELNIVGNREVDVLILVKKPPNENFMPLVVFEVDGGEHIGRKRTSESDRIKESICKKYGIRVFRISNNDVKNYEKIINSFKIIVSESGSEQMSLFDDF